jgi:predicted transcriptional regulator of viral defense system
VKQIEALAKIESLGHAFFETRDVAAVLRVSSTNANKIATRLADAGFVIRLARGRWALPRNLNKLAVPEQLAAPYPAYISLQTALYQHGLISQIPAVTYAVSLARTRRYDTPLGVFSIHHVNADFFFGFEADASGGAMIAVPEKALVDVLYFSPTRTRLFATLPELEIPKNFNWTTARKMAGRIRGQGRRKLVERKLAALKERHAGRRHP